MTSSFVASTNRRCDLIGPENLDCELVLVNMRTLSTISSTKPSYHPGS